MHKFYASKKEIFAICYNPFRSEIETAYVENIHIRENITLLSESFLKASKCM
jgi:hypothetical protein